MYKSILALMFLSTAAVANEWSCELDNGHIVAINDMDTSPVFMMGTDDGVADVYSEATKEEPFKTLTIRGSYNTVRYVRASFEDKVYVAHDHYGFHPEKYFTGVRVYKDGELLETHHCKEVNENMVSIQSDVMVNDTEHESYTKGIYK